MVGRGNSIGVARKILALSAMLAAGMPLMASGPRTLPTQAGRPLSDPICSETMRADARLSDVCFVDRHFGWAVGDRGTIRHTNDGGRSWHPQQSGLDCSLESVFFIDRQTGWAVGGESHPYTHTSSGVVLSTRDGGRSWTRNPHAFLPALELVRFFNGRQGWAVGCPSAMYPSGVFLSEDGGRGWKPLPGKRTTGWVAADFLAPREGILADARGTATILRQGILRQAATPRFGLRGIRRMELVPEVQPQVYGWLVGQGGLVMLTCDTGATWRSPPAELPEGIAPEFDFAALAVIGPNVWIAGSPGTRVFHSPDAGQSWNAFSTGQNLPIRSLAFVDEQAGWAVGELGTILATTDGGRSWTRQHFGGTRAALLGVFSEPRDVPLELFAKLSGNDGYLGAVEILNRRDLEVPPKADVSRAARLHEAMVDVGASATHSTWQFPLRQAGLKLTAAQVIEGWNAVNDGRGLEEMEAHVVRQIRTWRPEVVVTHDAGPDGENPNEELISRIVLAAARMAGDPTSYAEQITRAGLQAWNVKKVYGALEPDTHGAVNISTAELAERLGCSLADAALESRGLLEDRFGGTPESLGFSLLVDNSSRQPNQTDFFTGTNLQPGGEARRQLTERSAEGKALIQSITRRRHSTREIIDRALGSNEGGQLAAQVGDLTRELDPDNSARALHYLARRCHQSGHWPTAAETFELLVQRHPNHPLAPVALVWLIQYYCSGEAARRVGPNQRFAVQQASAPAIDVPRQEERSERAAAIAKQIEQTNPALFAEPRVRFPLTAADRRRGETEQAQRFYATLRRSATRDAWWTCAQGEHCLAVLKGSSPKPVLKCAMASSKPKLDGRLDDTVWQQAEPAELGDPMASDTAWPASVWLAHDGEFLYLAMRARQAPGAEYPIAEGPRPRDPDLSCHDRIDICLDVDRDFSTYYQLSIDHRGWPAEQCWGDSTWDPTWFVASGTEDGTWIAEAAIPLDQLTEERPGSKTTWAIGIQRTVPNAGFQCWNSPAAVEIRPEGFGYLAFE